MSGHSHWAGIKHQKGIADARRGQLFSKLLTAITAAAKTESNPEFNPRLKTAITKARDSKVPADNIARAVKRASEAAANLEELLLAAYGPGGVAILIEVVTDSHNRTISEVKKILSDHAGKWAETGTVLWAFKLTPERSLRAKFPQEISATDRAKLAVLVAALAAHADVQEVYTNAV